MGALLAPPDRASLSVERLRVLDFLHGVQALDMRAAEQVLRMQLQPRVCAPVGVQTLQRFH